MIAGSTLLGCALAPTIQAVAPWKCVQHAQSGWIRLVSILGSIAPKRPRTPKPQSQALPQTEQVTITPPSANQAALKMCSSTFKPGTALNSIGASGAGKLTAARDHRIMTVNRRKMCFSAPALDQYGPGNLGIYNGDFPQKMNVFDSPKAWRDRAMGTSALKTIYNWSAKPFFTLGMITLLGGVGGGAIIASTSGAVIANDEDADDGTPRIKLISPFLDDFNPAFRES